MIPRDVILFFVRHAVRSLFASHQSTQSHSRGRRGVLCYGYLKDCRILRCLWSFHINLESRFSLDFRVKAKVPFPNCFSTMTEITPIFLFNTGRHWYLAPAVLYLTCSSVVHKAFLQTKVFLLLTLTCFSPGTTLHPSS